jgi:hypothetical protein
MRIDQAKHLRLDGQDAKYAMLNGEQVWTSEAPPPVGDPELKFTIKTGDFLYGPPGSQGYFVQIYLRHTDTFNFTEFNKPTNYWNNHVNVDIDWGDGSPIQTLSNTNNDVNHIYPQPETEYDITITGSLKYFGASERIVRVDSWGYELGLSRINFIGGLLASTVPIPNNLPSSIWSVRIPFGRTSNDYLQWDISNVIEFNSCFANATDIPKAIEDWDVSNVISFFNMFSNADNISHIDFSKWDTSSAKIVSYMFHSYAPRNDYIVDVSSWNVENIIYALNMFSEHTLTTSLYDALLNSWSQQNVNPDGQLGVGFVQHSNDSLDGKTQLIDKGWIIGDGGNVDAVYEPIDSLKDRFDVFNPVEWEKVTGAKDPYVDNGSLVLESDPDVFGSHRAIDLICQTRRCGPGTSILFELDQVISDQSIYMQRNRTLNPWSPYIELYFTKPNAQTPLRYYLSVSDALGYWWGWQDPQTSEWSVEFNPVNMRFQRIDFLEDEFKVYHSADGITWNLFTTYRDEYSNAYPYMSFFEDFYSHGALGFINFGGGAVNDARNPGDLPVKIAGVNIVEIYLDHVSEDFVQPVDETLWFMHKGQPIYNQDRLVLSGSNVLNSRKLLANNRVYIEIDQFSDGSLLALAKNVNDLLEGYVSFNVSGTILEAYSSIEGQLDYDDYDPVLHKFIGFRVENETLYFETSTNGSSWTVFASMPTTWQFEEVEVVLNLFESGVYVLNGINR